MIYVHWFQIRKLLEENKALSAKLSEEAEAARKRIDELTEELQRHTETVRELEAQLQAQADYEEIKKELRYYSLCFVVF